MAKRVVKVQINGYYLVDTDLPDDVLGTASFEEFINHELSSYAYDAEDVLDLVEQMIEDMATKPTVKLELKVE